MSVLLLLSPSVSFARFDKVRASYAASIYIFIFYWFSPAVIPIISRYLRFFVSKAAICPLSSLISSSYWLWRWDNSRLLVVWVAARVRALVVRHIYAGKRFSWTLSSRPLVRSSISQSPFCCILELISCYLKSTSASSASRKLILSL